MGMFWWWPFGKVPEVSPQRSVPAVRLLRQHGFRNACQLQGGMLAWQKAELPVAFDGDGAPAPGH